MPSIALNQLVAAAVDAGLDAARPATISEGIAATRSARAAVLHLLTGAGLDDLVGDVGEAPDVVEADAGKPNNTVRSLPEPLDPSMDPVYPEFHPRTYEDLATDNGDVWIANRIRALQAERAAGRE